MKQVLSGTQRLQKQIIVLGDKETGKTNILQKFIKKKFEDVYKETYGANFYSKEIKINNLYKATVKPTQRDTNNSEVSQVVCDEVILNIWDTSGMESEIKFMPDHLFKKANGFFICCSYDSLSSLFNVKQWIDHIKKFYFSNIPTKSDIPVIILCNKFDLPPKLRKFGPEELKTQLKDILLSDDFKIKIYHEVSAKADINIDYVFDKMVNLLTGISNAILNKLYLSTDISVKTQKEDTLYLNSASKKSFALQSEKNSNRGGRLKQNKNCQNCCK